MFQDIKNRITETEVGAIIALAALDGTPAGTANEVVKYQSSDKLRFCGWVENDSVVGICGFEVHADKVEIHLVAVAADKQRQGVGGRMITALQKNYSLPIAAETDDDAVGFYRKRGFETTAFQRTKWGATRHACVLGLTPNPNNPLPVPGFDVTYVKPTITRPNILVGDFTYYSGLDFESRVTHHYEFYGDRLIIGKFCQIAADVTFVMNGANHRMNAVSTFPFYILEHWKQDVPPLSELPVKGDTVIGNDVWIGQNATILPGVHIGNGTIIGLNSVVGSDAEPYTIVAGNPARPIRKRFDDELIALLEAFKWWDRPIDEIQTLIPLLSDNDLERVRRVLTV